MPGCGRRGKPNAGFPSPPHEPLEIAGRDSHIPAAPATTRMEKWKSKNRIPTFPRPVFSLKNQKRKEPSHYLLLSSFRLISELEKTFTRRVRANRFGRITAS